MINTNTYFSSTEITVSNKKTVDLPAVKKEALTPQLYAICKYKHEFDNQPRSSSITWPEFCESFGTHQKRSKKSGICWSPSKYNADAIRGNENVVWVSMAVIDIDGGEPVERLIEKIDGYTYLIHSSYSHTDVKPKFRAILPLDKPIEATEWTEAWLQINAWVGGINDASTKDSSRLYFIPSCPLDSTIHFIKTGNGKLLNMSDLPVLSIAVKKDLSQNKIWQKPKHIDGIEPIPQDALGNNAQLAEMTQRCNFIQWASSPDNQPLVSEPLWMSMLSNQCRFEGGEEAAHEASCHHPEYDEATTDRKLERCITGSAPITCNRIKELGFDGCPSGGCKLPSGKVTKSPAGLGVWANKQAQSENADQGTQSSAIPNSVKSYIYEYHNGQLTFVNGAFYGYREGYWPRLNEQVDIRKTIALKFGRDATTKSINELHSLCKDFCASGEKEVTPNLNLICLQNGTLDVENAKLIEFNPDHHLTYKSKISWDLNARCDRWLQFLDQVFANDADKTEKIAFLKHWCGYCLVPDVSQHKFVWMVGAGGNGKGVLLAILTKLVGESNVSDVHIERLGEKFMMSELEGKLVNISSEISADATMADGCFKAIVSGDRLQAERKYQDSYSFKPYVRLIAATNHLPRLLDLSDGFSRRAIILSFNSKFEGNDKDATLESKLTAELSGILAWALEGLKELRAAGTFVVPASSVEALQQYKVESDPVALFAGSCLEFNDDVRMSPSEIYEGYKNWAKINGYAAFNIINFGKRLSALGAKHSRPGGDKKWHVKPVDADGFEWGSSIRISYMNTTLINNANVLNIARQYKL